MARDTRMSLLFGSLGFVLAGLVAGVVATGSRLPVHPALNRHAVAAFLAKGGEADRGQNDPDNAAQEDYDNRAYPAAAISPAQQQAAYAAFLSIAKLPGGKAANWQPLGPLTPYVPGPATYTGRPTVNSGRVTALAVSPSCHAGDCKIFVGAAGGGVWEADDALASKLNWHASGAGIPSNAIGSIIFDSTDPLGRTLYVGTGEPNGSGDSEAGVGLYKSTDFGLSWALVPGSVPVALGRSVGAIAVDRTNPSHILIGTAVARHGSSSANGGRFTPPGSPKIGLYESTDGGATFSLAFSVATDTVNPTSATGGDFFRGGVTKIQFSPAGVPYFSVFGYGLYRATGSGYEQVFASAGGGAQATSSGSRTEFALAVKDNKLRIYVGDTSGASAANFYRVDDASVPAAVLTNGTTNPGWTKLSSSTKGTTGYASYNFCQGQCSYDMVVASPPGRPDEVWLGGSMNYGEIFTANQPSNGRAVMRSIDAGVTFTDMTNDSEGVPLGMHPDQHAIVFAGNNAGVAFAGSDGGVIRTNGVFVDASSQCATRGISGADLTDCQRWLTSIPQLLVPLNDGLATLQFQSVSVNPFDPLNDIMGGTQDNGTWAFSSRSGGAGQGSNLWFESVGGDGGQSGVDAGNANIRFHTYFDAQVDVNFRRADPLGWNWVSDAFFFVEPGKSEPRSFYIPIRSDPVVPGTMFLGMDYVWRTLDNGGSQAYLDQHCNEFFGDFTVMCGDWVRIGTEPTSSATFGTDKIGGSYIVAVDRAPSDTSTLWIGTRRGRLFISKNANAAPSSVTYNRIDVPAGTTGATPGRFVSGIAIDPANPNHAFVSFSGYDAYTPSTPGHVFEVTYDANTNTAAWKNLSFNLGDQPVTGVVLDSVTGDLFVSTDFAVAMLPASSTTWVPAAGSFPPVATYGLTIDANARVLYAATHGRGVFKLDLSR